MTISSTTFSYLLIELVERLGARQLTYIPMLTLDDGSTDGRLKGYPVGAKRPCLHQFLSDCLDHGTSDIRQLRRFFAECSLRFSPYCDSTHFEHATRQAYFAQIPQQNLASAVVFLDPDNGIEVASMRPRTGHKYVRWSEIADSHARLDSHSCLVIYQHLPRVSRPAYFIRRAAESARHVADVSFHWLTDNQIAFLILSRAGTQVSRVLHDYARRNGLSSGPA